MARELEHLRLVASALAGRTVDVAATDAGEPAWTDGSTVYVPGDATGADRVRMIGVQASLLAAGSLEPEVVRTLARRPQLLRRYLAVEGHRALVANEEVLPPSVRRLVVGATVARAGSVEASLELARSRQAIEDAPRLFGTIHPRRLLAAADRTEMARATASAGLTTPGTDDRADLIELPDDDDDESIGHRLSSPVGGGGAVGRLLRKLVSPVRHRDGGGPPGADAPTHFAAGRPGAGRRAVSGVPPGTIEGITGFAPAGRAYPEWDRHRRRYRPDWCTVTEVDPPVRAAVGAPLPDSVALRRSLARLGIGLTRCRRQRQGDDIDIDAAVEARVDTLLGLPHDDAFYVESLRRRRDLAVLVLLDVSGSAGEPGTGGKMVHEHQRSAAASLTAALHALGDRVALFAFSSRGRQAVQLLRVKAFDDHLDGDVARRLSGLAPGAYTRLGAAIRHGTSILEERGGTPRRLLVVLSDGLAYDHGYEGPYGEADAHRALVEARRRGVGCLCLSVGTDAEPAALRRVFGAAAHATVPRAEELPGLIGPLFRAALRSAEAQRRAFQRQARTRERLEIEMGERSELIATERPPGSRALMGRRRPAPSGGAAPVDR
ncbi:MAG: VWA domain-containing protein [Acidimicrobiales bacterium]